MCKVCVNGFFYPTDTLPKLKVHKAFILRPGWCTAKLGRKYKSSFKVCLETPFTKNSCHIETSQF